MIRRRKSRRLLRRWEWNIPEYAHVYKKKVIDRQMGSQTDGKTDRCATQNTGTQERKIG